MEKLCMIGPLSAEFRHLVNKSLVNANKILMLNIRENLYKHLNGIIKKAV